MDTPEAKTIASRLVMRNLAIALLIGELIFLFIETRGDFANGILFFIDAQANVFAVITAALLFLGAYLFGRIAGYSILIKKKNPFGTAAFYGGITFVMTVYTLHMVRFYSQIGSLFQDALEGGKPDFPFEDDAMGFYNIDLPTNVLIGLFGVVAASWLTTAWQLKTKYVTSAQ